MIYSILDFGLWIAKRKEQRATIRRLCAIRQSSIINRQLPIIHAVTNDKSLLNDDFVKSHHIDGKVKCSYASPDSVGIEE